MKVVESTEFALHSADLIQEVKSGETVRIAEGGTIIAEIKPLVIPEDPASRFRRILEGRKDFPLVSQAEWAEWIDEGHR